MKPPQSELIISLKLKSWPTSSSLLILTTNTIHPIIGLRNLGIPFNIPLLHSQHLINPKSIDCISQLASSAAPLILLLISSTCTSTEIITRTTASRPTSVYTVVCTATVTFLKQTSDFSSLLEWPTVLVCSGLRSFSHVVFIVHAQKFQANKDGWSPTQTLKHL